MSRLAWFLFGAATLATALVIAGGVILMSAHGFSAREAFAFRSGREFVCTCVQFGTVLTGSRIAFTPVRLRYDPLRPGTPSAEPGSTFSNPGASSEYALSIAPGKRPARLRANRASL